MRLWLITLCLMVLGVCPAQAQTVRVTGGDHADFTRIVLEFPEAVNWKLGRTADGYQLRIAGGAKVYDLSSAFSLISRDRLAAIWADPGTGDLNFNVACACHAIPFEFRPGTVVVDLRDGPPPEGSSFEDALDGGETAAVLQDGPEPRPRPRPLDDATKEAKAAPPLPFSWKDLPSPQVAEPAALLGVLLERNLARPEDAAEKLDTLRADLIEELGRGATQGIVDMAPPAGKAESDHGGEAGEADDGQAVSIYLADGENLDLRQKGEAPEPISAEGRECLPDERLAIAEWANAETPIAEQFGPAMEGLVGEFDRPEPDAVARAMKFYLHMGFGAEARELLRVFPSEQEDAAIWTSLAHLLDDEEDPDSAFAGMAACNTSAALWALLADPEVLALGQVEKAAVLRGFSALPGHLRREIGPKLVKRFLDMKDVATATALRDSVLRGGNVDSAEVELMEAALEKAGGSPASSVARLEDLAKDAGSDTPDALAELVIQRAELGQSVDFSQVQALEAFVGEHEGSDLGDRLDLALTLAHAASGDFAAAFDRLPETPEAEAMVWQILARSGGDTPLLEHAVLPEDSDVPKSAHGSATLIAQRLAALGLADQAAHWLALEREPPAILAARVALGQGDASRALELLGEVDGKPADDLRLAAYRQLGDDTAIADLSDRLGDATAEWAAISRSQDWQSLAADGPELWQNLARRALRQPLAGAEALPPPAGPLDHDHRLVEDSLATRAAIDALLQDTDLPEVETQ